MEKTVIAVATVAFVAGALTIRKYYEKKIEKINHENSLKVDRTFFSSFHAGWRDGEKHGRKMAKFDRIFNEETE